MRTKATTRFLRFRGDVVLLTSLLATFIISCAPTPTVEPFDESELIDERIGFIVDGETTREDVLLRLGEPTGRHEGDRVLTYVMHVDTVEGSVDAADPRRDLPSTLSHVVLVFDAHGRLIEHSVVGVQ